MAKLAEVKTKPTTLSVTDFLNSLTDKQRRDDSLSLLAIMQRITKEEPRIWGTSIIGFGYVVVTSPSGRQVEWFKVGFSPRKANLSIYLSGSMQTYANALEKLGKHKTGGGCLYINKLSDVDVEVLEQLIKKSLEAT